MNKSEDLDSYESSIIAYSSLDESDERYLIQETTKTALFVYRKFIKNKELKEDTSCKIFGHGNDTFCFTWEIKEENIPYRKLYLSCFEERISIMVFHVNERVFSCSFDLKETWYNIEALLVVLLNESKENGYDQ